MKFSSNVIEKCLDKADQEIVSLYAEELSKSERVRILVRNIYGYYVVERVLMRCTNEAQKSVLCDEILKNLAFLGNKTLKTKWFDLINRSKIGKLFFIQYKDA